MASKKKKKKFSEQVITGSYESSMTKDKVGSALRSNSRSVADAYKQYKKTEDTSGGMFSAFDDGYDIGDITKSLLKGTSKLGETIFKTGKEIVTNPIESVKTGGVGIASGVDRADTLINNATEDFFTWISPWRDKEDNKGLSLKEFNELSSATDEKTKNKLLKEYADKYGKDSSQYKTIELQLQTKPRKSGTYKDTETYKKAQAGELSEGQQNIYGVGENIGAMLPSVGVSMVAGPGAGSAVFFTQAQQGYTEEAKERGYSDTEARTYGLIMGTAEVVVERLGFDELGGMKKLSNGSIMKAMGGEALEEAVMPYVEDVVTYGIYEDGYSWEEFGESTEEALKGAVMGGTVGAIMRAGGKGFTKVDALIQKAENGQQITQADIQGAIEELEEKDPGYIEQYVKEGVNVVKEQNATMNQHTASAQENLQDIAPVQETIDTTEIDEIAPVVAKEVLQPTLVSGKEVRGAGQQDIAPVEAPVQDNRYVYTPQETDSQYKQAVSKSAETVGLENNASTQTLIDLTAKVSERTGKPIEFTNNSQPEMIAQRNKMIQKFAKNKNISIEEATARLQGTTINGLTDGNRILINTDSNGYLNVILGHEITHTFEKLGKTYTDLQDAVFSYASEIGEFELVSDVISATYEGQSANINQELTSELVGRYLFTDQTFIDNLSAKKPNLFQRVYNEIKHLIKMATAGSNEARALEEVKYRFEKAMNKVASNKTNKATVQETKDKSTTERLSNTKKEFSLEKELEKDLESKIMDKKAQIDFFENYLEEEGITNPTEQDMYDSWGTYEQMDSDMDSYVEAEKEYYKTIREYLKDRLSTDNKGRELSEEQIEFFEDSVVRDKEGRLLTMYHGTRADFNVFESDRAGQNYEDNWSRAGRGHYFTPDIKYAKDYGEASVEKGPVKIKEVYLNITNPFDMATDYSETLTDMKNEYNIDEFYLKAGYRLIDWFRDAKIDSTEVLKKYGYDGIHDFDDYIAFESNQIKDVENKNPTENEDIRYSLSKPTTDSEGRTLTKEQQEFFKDSKVRDAEGNLRVMHHGTKDDFTVFENEKRKYDSGFAGQGFYFTSGYETAQDYSNWKKGNNDFTPKVMSVYLNAKNPLVLNEFKSGLKVAMSETLGVDINTRNPLKITPEESKKITKELIKQGYDGVLYEFGGDTYAMVINSNQIKNVDNTNPTESEDIRYSLSDNTDKLREQLLVSRDVLNDIQLRGMKKVIAESKPNFFSKNTDNLGRKLSKGMKEYMKDSKARDINDSLTTVYHTTTNEVTQFNEFNPVGTDWYRFGDQVVNYYTDSKFMSGSYAEFSYDMAKTKKLNSMEDAEKWLEDNRFATDRKYDYEIKTTPYGAENVILYEYDSGKLMTVFEFQNESDLLRNLQEQVKRVLIRYNQRHNIQYEGYVNITNPYVVDAEGRGWKYVETKFNDDKQKDLNKITSDPNKVKMLESLASASRTRYEEYDFSGDEWTYYHYKNTADALKGRQLNEAVQFCAMFNFEYNAYTEGLEGLPSGDTTVTDLTSDLTETNYNMFKDMTLSDFVRVYAQEYEKNMLYGTEDSYFKHEYKNITGELKELPASDLYKIARKHFTEDSITDAIVEYSSTNDIVHKVIEMNKNGSNYDGVIMKNVIDYGTGMSREEALPNDLYVTFNSNQFKAWDNENPTSDADIRYSLSTDNQGNEIKPAVQKWSEKSQARDENGQLKVLYHGSPRGEFTVFDKNKANPEGDWGAGFYLTDNEYDVESNYADGGGDFDNQVARLSEQMVGDYPLGYDILTDSQIEPREIDYEEARNLAREHLYKGYYRIDAYVNIENPAIVGKTYLFDDYGTQYNEEDFEDYDEYQEATDQLIADKVEEILWDIENNVEIEAWGDWKADLSQIIYEAYYSGGIDIASFKTNVNNALIDVSDSNGNLVANEIARQTIESLGYDGIIDPTVSSKFKGMHLDEGTTHYIVFKPSQIKNISNENPTDNPDINMSLSKEGEELAPIGDFNIKGSDVRLQKQVEEAIAPLKEEIETLTKTITDLQENIAPASFESAEEQRAETQRTMTDEDAPLTDDGEFIFTEDVPLKGKGKDNITREIANDFDIKYTEARELYNKVANTENPTVEDVFDILKDYRNVKTQVELDEVNAIQHTIKGTRIDVSEFKNQITDYKNYRISNMGKGLILGNSGEKVDSVYQELNEMYGENAFPSSVTAEVDQLDVISQWLYKEPYLEYTDTIDDDSLYDLAGRILSDVGNTERYRTAEAYRTNWFRHYKDDIMAPGEAPRIKTEISQEDYLKSLPDGLTDDYAPYLEMAREVNASNTENSTGNTSISDELSRLSINPFEEIIEAQNEEKQAPRVTKEKPGLKSAYGTVQELIFNDTYQIDKLAKETNRPSIKHNNYMLKGVHGEIPGDILVGQTDNYGNIIGLSVKDLWQPAHESGLFNQFNDRMKHQLNIERWKTNKPLWYEIPAEASQEIVKAYDETYPEFKEWAEDIYNFYANSLDNKYEAGLVNDAQRKLLREELYPSYVRIDVEQLEKPYVDITPGEIRSKAPLKRAVGGSGELAMSLEESMIKSVYADKMGIRQNKLYLEIAKALEGNRAEVGADVRQELADMSEALYLDADTGQHYLTAYENGEQFTVEIDKELYDGLKNDLKQTLKNIETKLGKPLELVQKAGNLKRDLTTTYNPFFWLTNPPKDLFDALINSKNVKGFMKNYPIAWKEAITNTGDAPKFRALYGSAMDMGDYSAESGLGDTEGKLAKKLKNTKLLRGINKLNEITEIVTRLAEFKASKETGASLEEAMYNAREVTVNFDRGGTVTKFLDRNGFKFLNVSAQGFDKFIRNFSGQEGARATMGAWARAVAFGIAPALINHLLFGGDDDEEKDEDYEALPDYIKDNYFLFKMDNGEFVRIPKGRMMAVFGSAGRRTLEFLGGETDAYEGFFENSESQVGMANPFDNFLLAPLFQAYGSENGTTWYGEELIPSRLQDKAPEEQYDASTDKASIFLGELFGISPYKLNYVIDQYTGGIGDLVLPMITEETKTDGSLMAPFIDKFTANSTDDNKYASEIYSLGDKRDKVPTAEKETDLYKIQDAYLYSITSEMGELYAEKREVQADSSLTKKEKYEMVQEIQKQINSLAKEGLENYEYVSQKENYAIVGGREFNKYTASDGSERWGTPWEDELNDLNSMGMDLAEKNNYFTSKKYITDINDHYKDLIDNASEEEKDGIYAERKREVIKAVQDTDLNDEMKAYLYNKYYSSDKTKVITKLGIDFDTYLDFESQQFEADKNSAGKSISGSKKAKVFAYINSMNLDFEERLILAKLQYNSYDTYNAEIINYLNNHSDISYDEEVEILQKLGFTVDANGRIYWK